MDKASKKTLNKSLSFSSKWVIHEDEEIKMVERIKELLKENKHFLILTMITQYDKKKAEIKNIKLGEAE